MKSSEERFLYPRERLTAKSTMSDIPTKQTKNRSDISNEMFAVSKRVGMAIGDYDMIQEGDRIMVAVSGGKDSLSLLKLLHYRQSFAPVRYDILAVHLNVGIPGFPLDKLEKYFIGNHIPFHIQEVKELQNQDWKKITCFWCAWTRRKALFLLAEKLGYNKIALGHHMDDIVETILLNMFYNGEISTMRPKQELFDGKITLIRPLAYVKESMMRRMAQKEGMTDLDTFQCPQNESSKRMAIKTLLAQLERDNPSIKKNIFKSLTRVKQDYLLDDFREDDTHDESETQT